MLEGIIGKIVLGFIRHSVSGLGTGLVTQGILQSDQQTQFVGSVMFLVGVGFSAYDKVQAKGASK